MIAVPVEQYLKDLAAVNWCYNYHRVSTPDTNVEMIKADPSLIFGWTIFNNAAYPIYVKLFNTSVATAVGANRVHKTIGVEANKSNVFDCSSPIILDRGLCIAIVKDLADSGLTPVLANDCVVDIHYR